MFWLKYNNLNKLNQHKSNALVNITRYICICMISQLYISIECNHFACHTIAVTLNWWLLRPLLVLLYYAERICLRVMVVSMGVSEAVVIIVIWLVFNDFFHSFVAVNGDADAFEYSFSLRRFINRCECAANKTNLFRSNRLLNNEIIHPAN